LDAAYALAGESGDRAYWRRLTALFCGGWFIVYADRTVLYPLLTAVAAEFGLSGVQTGLITGTYFGCYVTAQLLAGLLAERFGLKRILVLFAYLSAIGLAGFGLFAGNFPLLLLVAGFHGAGAGAYYGMAYSITIHTIPGPERGRAAGIINGGMALGLAAGLALAGPLYHATGSWRAPFLILALPTFLVAWLFQRVVREVEVPHRRSTRLLELVTDPTLLRMSLAGFCVLYGWWMLLSWGPVFLQTERGIGLTQSGLYTLVIAVTALPSGLLLGRLSDRIGRKRIVLTMLPLMAGCLAAVALVGSHAGMLALLLAYGVVGKLAWDPLAIAWLGDTVARQRPESVAVAVSVFSFVSVSSAVVGPPVTGWIKDLTGSLAGGFYIAAAIAAIAFLLSVGLPDPGRGQARA
jgi:MFS family permease